MNAPDIFALGGRDETQDAEILALFRQWIECCYPRGGIPDPDKDALEAACVRLDDIEDRIFKSRGGPIGLAVKAYLNCRLDWAEWTPQSAHLCFDAEEGVDSGWMASAIRDAAWIIPEIGELAAAVIHEDAKLIAADFAPQWVDKVWGEKPEDEWPGRVFEKESEALDCIANTEARTARGEAIKARHKAGGSAP